MKSLQRQERIVEKVLKTKAGQYVRAVFLVYELNGKLEARLLSAKPVQEGKSIHESRITNKILCLNSNHNESAEIISCIKHFRTSSPYFNIFSFFTSQPTRAPSL